MSKRQAEDDVDLRQKGLENLIVLILGSSKKRTSMLHLEKEAFLLWSFHPGVKKFIRFIKHYRGPFSKEIQETVKAPMYCLSCWDYFPPQRNDMLSGGYIRITSKGERESDRLIDRMKEDFDLRQLLSAIRMVHELYHKVSVEELLLLIYDAYPEYIEESDVYRDINRRRRPISLGLFERGLIDQKRLESLLEGKH